MLANLEEQRIPIPRLTEPQLGMRQRIALKIQGRAFLRYEKREGWIRHIPIYAATCKLHGLFEDYPHGWEDELRCPKCLFEMLVEHVEE